MYQSDKVILLFDTAFQFFQGFLQFLDFPVLQGIVCLELLVFRYQLGLADTGIGVSFANLEADAGVEHIFPIAEVRAQAEHGIFIGTIEGAEGDTVGIAVIAITDSEVPFVIGIEVQRMERCQSRCTGSDFVYAVIQVGNTVIDVLKRFRFGSHLMIQSRYV